MRSFIVVPAAVALLSITSGLRAQSTPLPVLELWKQGKPAFGVFVPNENAQVRPAGGAGVPVAGGQRPPASGSRPKPLYTKAGGAKLAASALYDFVFLNLEASYDGDAVRAIAEGLRSGAGARRVALIVRIPPFHADPAAARARVREIVAAGGDGVTFPHVESLDEAKEIVAVFREQGIDVWSPANPAGDKIAMLMLEDPKAVAQASAIAGLKGYSVLACGIGSLTQALGGNREAGEAGTQQVLAETRRTGLVNMLTATTADVEKRVKEGFLGILAQGPNADDAIRAGRAAAGR